MKPATLPASDTSRSFAAVVLEPARRIWRARPGSAYAMAWHVFVVSFFVVIGAQVAATVLNELNANWWPAYDTHAYWLAARHLLDGSPLYAPATISDYGAYKYPPIFAQMAAPIALLPEWLVNWVWRIGGVACLRYLCGSWRLTLVASLQWPVFAELSYGNVTLQLGAVALLCFRDARAAYLLPWFAALKGGPGLLIPYLWLTRPQARRPLIIGCLVFVAACALSVAVAPGLWSDYVATFGWEAESLMKGSYILAVVPDHGGLDFVIRLAVAVVAMGAAIRWRKDWLAFIAATATMPILAITRLAVLVGLWPLWLREHAESWCRGTGRRRAWVSELLTRLGLIREQERGISETAGAQAEGGAG